MSPSEASGEGLAAAPLELPDPPWIVAHRGLSARLLENTAESCRAAVEAGADMVEIDVQLAADGELVVCHDFDLSRLGDGEAIVVEATPSPRLVGRRIGLERDGRRLEGRLPHLDEVLDAVPADFPVNVEAKHRAADRERFAERLAQVSSERGSILVSSYDLPLLTEIRRIAPHLSLAPIGCVDAAELVAAGNRLDAWSLHCERTLFDPALVESAAPRPVLVYTVNDVATSRRLLDSRVFGLFTDDVELVRAGLRGAEGSTDC